MTQTAIKAAGVGKQYIIGSAEQQYDSFREMLTEALKAPFQKYKTLSGQVAQENKFWALDDINFEIQQGDIVGVIGHNGAGKSTLLKVLSRITSPTVGEVAIRGRVASLLEVGTGFHPELTGRENIYLNGSILGMRRNQIDKRFDEIVEFADIARFLDTPVKRYSSGMYVRLAFSVAAHLDTDVLLVDEVLAVGDQKFQEKCLGMLGDVSSAGRTVLFVSHNLASVAKLCSNVLVLDQGKVAFDGPVLEGISHYNNQMRDTPVLSDKDYIGELYPNVRFEHITFDGEAFVEGMEIDPLHEVVIEVAAISEIEIDKFRLILAVQKHGQLIFRLFDDKDFISVSKGAFRATFVVPAKLLLPGEHTFSLGGVTDAVAQWLWTRHYNFNVIFCSGDGYDTSIHNNGLINIDGH